MNRNFSMATAVAAIAVMGVYGAAAQTPELTALGTLTCTTGDTKAQGQEEGNLSCLFKSNVGRDGSYTGSMQRAGAADVPQGKHVLMWSVLAPGESDIGALVGVYRGETGGVPEGVLIGGKDRKVRLEPTSVGSQIADQPAPTLLELKLGATKT